MDQIKRLSLLVATGTASEDQLKTLGREGVISAKSTMPQMRAKMGEPTPSEGTRVIRFIASDETADRMGDIIKVDGWELGNFVKNPVILWGHKGHEFPIGKGVPSIGTKADGAPALFMDIEFATAEQNPEAETVYQLAKGGFLNAVSVGFIPKEITEVADDQRLELGLGMWGQLITKAELLELSVCSVPMNANAIQAGIKSLREAGLDSAADKLEKATPDTERDLFAAIEHLKTLVEVDEEEVIEPNTGTELLKAFERIAVSQADTAESLAKMLGASRQLVDAIADLTSKLSFASDDPGGSVPDAESSAAPEDKSISPETAEALTAIAKTLKSLTS